MKLTIDFETRSECDLKNAGAWAYAEHPSTEIFCMAVKAEDRPTQIWINPKFSRILSPKQIDTLPTITSLRVNDLFRYADIVEAHNVEFEQAIYEHVLTKKHEVDSTPVTWRCSAAKAARYSLPRDLNGACLAVGTDIQKDKIGRNLIPKLCKPRKPTKNNPSKWDETPQDLLSLFKYCITDVDAEHALSSALPDLSQKEQEIFDVSSAINRRGFYVDTPAAQRAIDLINKYSDREIARFKTIVSGRFNSPRQVAKMLAWLGEQGVEMPDLTKASVKHTLKNPELPGKVRDALEVRQNLSKSSTAKFKRMVQGANSDNRMRGTMMYYGTSTGRYTGRRVQPQNMPRKMPSDVESIFQALSYKDLDLFEITCGNAVDSLSGSIRAFILAQPGHELLCADYASIEGRVLAWVAEEKYVLDNYRDGKDAYCVFASQIHGTPYEEIRSGYKKGIEKYGDMRFEGKVGELACGYQGGEGAIRAFAPDMPQERREDIVRLWRNNRPMTKKLWYKMEDCAKKAIQEPGLVYSWNRIRWVKKGKFLLCELPSGRFLTYYDPAIIPKMTPWGEMKGSIHFYSVDSMTRKWGLTDTYGGKLVENAISGIARDILAEALVRISKHKTYQNIILHVHDEIITEVLKGEGKVKEFCDLMAENPVWADGLPLAADGFRTTRYRKG